MCLIFSSTNKLDDSVIKELEIITSDYVANTYEILNKEKYCSECKRKAFVKDEVDRYLNFIKQELDEPFNP